MPRFDFGSINLDGEEFEIINKSVKLRLATQTETFTYKRQPRGGVIKIESSEFRAIQEALESSKKSKLTTTIFNTNGTQGNFINTENIASFTEEISIKSRAGKDLPIKALKNQLQKSLDKLSSRPIYKADQINEESINPSRTFLVNVTTTPNQVTFGGTATGEITLTRPTGGDSTFSRQNLTQTTNVDLSTYNIVLETTSNNLNAATYGSTVDVVGSNTADTISTGSGNDTITGNAGVDTIDGGAGSSDTANYSTALKDDGTALGAGDTGITLFLNGATAATVTVGGTNVGADQVSNIENIIGTNGKDILTGDGLANIISGGTGNDTITGGAGDDTITGGAGDDIITGGAGADSLTGGAGNNRFFFNGARGSTDVLNSITDFDLAGTANLIDFITNAATFNGGNYGKFGAIAVADGARIVTMSDGFSFVTAVNGNVAASLAVGDVANFLANVDGLGADFIFDSPDQVGYIAVTDGTDLGIYLAEQDIFSGIGVGDLTLIATLNGVTAITAANLVDFV